MLCIFYSAIVNSQDLKLNYSSYIYSSPFYSWEKGGFPKPEKLVRLEKNDTVKAINFYLIGNEKRYVGDLLVEFQGKTGWMSSIVFNSKEIRKIPRLEILAFSEEKGKKEQSNKQLVAETKTEKGKLLEEESERDEAIQNAIGLLVNEYYNKEKSFSKDDELVKELQRNLIKLNYDLGVFGVNKNGMDGILGAKTKTAIGNFEQDYLKRIKEMIKQKQQIRDEIKAIETKQK